MNTEFDIKDAIAGRTTVASLRSRLKMVDAVPAIWFRFDAAHAGVSHTFDTKERFIEIKLLDDNNYTLTPFDDDTVSVTFLGADWLSTGETADIPYAAIDCYVEMLNGKPKYIYRNEASKKRATGAVFQPPIIIANDEPEAPDRDVVVQLPKAAARQARNPR
ncbi:MAG: hypothetical protein AB7G06_07765 [Bdellovibrionales bacterium]